MTTSRYALTLVFEVDFVTSPADEGTREHFEELARSAVATYSTRTVSATRVVFLSVSKDASTEAAPEASE